jgi:hypothetical protein
MKKLLALSFVFVLSFSNTVFADGDLWDNFGDQNFYGTKAVSEKDFDNAIKVKKGEKKPKKTKGDTFHQGNETEIINQKAEELPIVCITTDIKIDDDTTLPIGHYQVMSEKGAGNKIYLKLYQGHFLMAEFEAIETFDDFDEPEINFAKFIIDGNKYKLIYGSIDYNAYVNLEPATVVQ